MPWVIAADNSPEGVLHHCAFHEISAYHVPCRHWSRGLAGALPFLFDSLRIRKAYRRGHRQGGTDLVHANTVRAGLAASIALPRAVPLVVHVRDADEPALARRLLAKRVAAIVAVSEVNAKRWREAGAPNVEVIHNAFDLEALDEVTPTAELSNSGGGFNLIMVADLVRWKRHGLFLDAFARILRDVPEARAVVVGRSVADESSAYLRELRDSLRARGIEDAVMFVRDCENAVPWMAAADVLVHTAENEPFGRVLVESLAVGTPVVATNEGGHTEVLADAPAAGALVPPEPDAIARAVMERRCPVNRLAVYAEARRCAARYDVKAVAPQVVTLYERLLGD